MNGQSFLRRPGPKGCRANDDGDDDDDEILSFKQRSMFLQLSSESHTISPYDF